MFSQILSWFRRMGSPSVLVPAWLLSKASMRPAAQPQGRLGWKTVSGLIIGSYFLLKTQGAGSFLQQCDKHQSHRDKTKQMDRAEARELSTLSQKRSSSVPLLHEITQSIKVTFSGFTSLTPCIFVPCVALFHGAHLFSTASFPFCLL